VGWSYPQAVVFQPGLGGRQRLNDTTIASTRKVKQMRSSTLNCPVKKPGPAESGFRRLPGPTRSGFIQLEREAGGITAEYAIAILTATGFAGLLLVILQSDVVRNWLLDIVQRAFSL
jgi:hypothetical protein